ncbi:uracil-DNA glycosylase family protein [Synechococcus sp. FACHB-909]|uniref:uracil-DNA glycosylase family protein n=1 Tax=Synechococcus sp. FACHB-909 TaxID=2692863 RepID=UPI001687A80A|nr:uracil-DNA glycosylase family protein [Synechococcus sp. FACHB-909]MBD2718214.1 hypothetical protein [Synechococcus sp. FACHB-909]
MTIHSILFDLLETSNIRYPKSDTGDFEVVPVPKGPIARIAGRAFFPGGSGSSSGENHLVPENPILVIGNNFGSYSYYLDCVQTHKEEPLSNSTWGELLHVYQQAGLDPSFCFHTNVFMGYLPGDKNSESMKITKAFKEDCYSFLVKQILTVKPRAIIAVGAKSKDALSHLANGKIPSWSSATYAALYQNGHFFHRDIDLSSTTLEWRGDLLTMTHPALRRGNFGKIRKNEGFDPEPIEIEGLSSLVERNV